MAAFSEPKWEFHHGMWVKAVGEPGPPMPEQDALYRKWFLDGQEEAMQANSRESAEKARERV